MRDVLSRNPRLALGTAQWGSVYGIANRNGQPTRAEVGRLLARAKLAGVTTLDAARAYRQSEAIIGEMVGPDPAWEVFTKVDPAAATADAAAESLRTSREALRRPVLDGVLLHRAWQRTADAGALWDLLRRQRDAGEIHHIGVSAGSPEEAWQALEDREGTCIQVACSLLDPRLSRAGFFEECHRRGRLVFVRGVFLQGIAHMDPETLPSHLGDLREPLSAARQWAAGHGQPTALAFLAFAARLTETRILLGCETAAQFEENLQTWNVAQQCAADVALLANAIPPLAADVLDPACWPRV